MSESQSKPTLNQLIGEAREGAIQQQEATHSRGNQRPMHLPNKSILGLLLLGVLAVVLGIQYPRMQAPYSWPEAKSSSVMVEADLEAVAGLIETYRISQGQYPAVLSQVTLPGGLAALVTSSVLVYRPMETAYTLDWTLPYWHATYDSRTGKTNVEPVGKH